MATTDDRDDASLNELLTDLFEGSPSHDDEISMDELVECAGFNNLPPRLLDILKLIDEKTPWSLDESPESHDAQLILTHRENPILWQGFPRRSEANKVHPSEPCVFLVDKAMPNAGKRKKTSVAAASSSDQPVDDDEWIKYSGSGSKSLVDLGNFEAVLKIHCSLPAALVDTHGKKKIGQYCIVLRPGHPDWDSPFPSNKPREVETVKRNGETYKHKHEPHLYLMHSMPDGTTAPPRPQALVGDSLQVSGQATIAGDLSVAGSIHGRFEGARADFAEFMPRYSLEEELNKGDVVALVGNGAEHASISRSARGSHTPEWRVVTTDPLLLGNPSPDVDEETQVGIVRSGQVPVRVVGEPPTDAYLVPSGDEDGRARALRDGERPRHVVGRVVASKVRNGRVEALVEPGLAATLTSDYFENKMNLLQDENERVRTDNVRLKTENLRAQAEAERMRAENERLCAAEVAMQGLSVGTCLSSTHNSAAAPARPESPVPPPASIVRPGHHGEWPWDVPGTLGFDGKVITPSVALLNRMDLKHKIFSSREVGGKAVRKAGDTADTHFYTAQVTIASTGQAIVSTECPGWSAEEAIEDASRRLLEADDSKLMQLLEEATKAAVGCSSDATSVGLTDTTTGVQPMSSSDLNTLAATTGKQRLNAMAMRLCSVSMQMADLQNQKLVVYVEQDAFDQPRERLMQSHLSMDPSRTFTIPEIVAEVEAATCYSVSLPLCEGQPRVCGAVAQSKKASQHSAAERTIAFVERVLESLSDPSYAFRFAELAELLAELREMRRTHESSMKSSFKELLHVMAMRLKRPAWDELLDDSVCYLRYTPAPSAEGDDLGLSQHGTPLERSQVSLVRFDGEPTFTGAPAGGRRAAEQSAAEAALAFIFERVAELRP